MKVLKNLADDLAREGLLEPDQATHLSSILDRKLISVFHELRVAVSVGSICLTTGVGIWLHTNFKSVGEVGILFVLTSLTVLFGFMVYTRFPGFSTRYVANNGLLYEYSVLLAHAFFAFSVSYADFAFDVFQGKHSVVALITAVFGLILAYLCDHRGVLSLAIVALASFIGLNLELNGNELLRYSHLGISFGLGLAAFALLLDYRNIKAHFTVIYLQFAAFCLCVSVLTGVATETVRYLVPAAVLIGGLAYLSFRFRSLVLVLFSYFAAVVAGGIVIGKLLGGSSVQLLLMMYFLGTGVVLLITVNAARSRFQETKY